MPIKRRSGGAFSKRKITFKKVKKMKENHSYSVFRCVLAVLYEGLSVRPSVGPSVDPSVGLSVGPSVRRSFHPSVQLSVRPLVRP